MLLSDVLKGIKCDCSEIPEMDVENITAKANLIKEKTLFVLYKSINRNNDTRIEELLKMRPCAILTDINIDIKTSIPIIYTKNARMAYSYAMYNFCKINPKSLSFYAVTGSCGKTTTATILYSIFRKANFKCGFIGTGKILINDSIETDKYYSMTTPDPELLYPLIQKMQSLGCEKIVMEVSSHALALHKVAPIKFECSIFTNLSSEHLDFHGSIEEYYKTKLSIFSQSKKAIFNLDDAYSRRAFLEIGESLERYSVGVKNDADAVAKEIVFEGIEGSSYIYRERNLLFKIKLNLGGEYNISNSLLAIKCALLSGIEAKTIKEALQQITGIDGRLEKVCNTPSVIIDYAHTDNALENVLKFIKANKKSEQKLISVFGCGGERDKEKRPRMAKISEENADFTLVTSDNSRGENSREILKEIEKGFKKSYSYSVIENRAEAIREAILKSRDCDIILIIGKGHERYNIDSLGYHSFDEREIIKKALEERKIIQNENKNRNTANTFFDI